MKDIDSVPSNVQSARQEVLLYVFEDNEAVIMMIIKDILQWFTFPEHTELLLIGCSIELIWTPKSKSKTLTPQTNSDILTKVNFTRDEWNHVLSFSTQAISVLQSFLKWCQTERKKNQVKKESQQSQDQWWVLIARTSSTLSFIASESPCTSRPKIITVLTRFRPIVLKSTQNCNACNIHRRRFFRIN